MKGNAKVMALSIAAIFALSVLAIGVMADKPQQNKPPAEPTGNLVMTSAEQVALKITGYVRIYDWVNGKYNNTWSGNLGDNSGSVGTIGDIDNDGKKEVIASGTVKTALKGNRNSYTYTFKVWHDGDASDSPSVSTNLAKSIGTMAVGDVDKDGKNELVISATGATSDVEVWNCSSSGCSVEATIPKIGATGINLGDADDDGYPEIVLPGGSATYGWSGMGIVIDYADGKYTATDLGTPGTPCPIDEISVGDLDGTAGNELFGSGYCNGNLYIWQYSNGGYEQIWNKKITSCFDQNNEIADINGDGKNEFVFTQYCMPGDKLIAYKYDGNNSWSELGSYSGSQGSLIDMMVSSDPDGDGAYEIIEQERVFDWDGSKLVNIQNLTNPLVNRQWDLALA